ncbi:hypothetical protein CJD36_000780 [Flavipsychrobacter stenotrophus]|uniref:Uncharacterized protein n=1 Tax=Flavipsychrobacter stenotrophus TaxID=2077091 RepID=A0A2S7T1N8_9BACT|nr:hypothetical protein CJD36_000780 [Flavipsychrobacter stenotrophus]
MKKSIENHKQAAQHHEEAAKHHKQAAKHHEEGNHDRAHTSTVIANGHAHMASEKQTDDAKHHAVNSK